MSYLINIETLQTRGFKLPAYKTVPLGPARVSDSVLDLVANQFYSFSGFYFRVIILFSGKAEKFDLLWL